MIMSNHTAKGGLFSRLFYDRVSAAISALGGLIFCAFSWDIFPFPIFAPLHFLWLYLFAYRYFLCKGLEWELRQSPVAIEGWGRYKLLKLGRRLAWRSYETLQDVESIPVLVKALVQTSMLGFLTKLNNIIFALIILLWVSYLGIGFL